MNPADHILYHPEDAQIMSDGLLRIPTGGSAGNRLVSGFEEVPPQHPDHDFWLWLAKRRKRSSQGFRAMPGLDEHEIAVLRDEYKRENG